MRRQGQLAVFLGAAGGRSARHLLPVRRTLTRQARARKILGDTHGASAGRGCNGGHERMSAAAPSAILAASDHGRIPVLDIGPYLAGDARRAAPLARAIARTCEDTGFLVVANHGVPPRLVEDTFAVAAQFFARPEADKLALKIGQYNIGYLPVRRPDRAAFAGQQQHQAEFQRELLHHPRPRPRPPGHRQQQAAGRAQPLARRTCPSSAPRRRPTTPRWRR